MGLCSRAPGWGVETVTAGAGPLSETSTRAGCVTLPTMALPPSRTDTFCTYLQIGYVLLHPFFNLDEFLTFENVDEV